MDKMIMQVKYSNNHYSNFLISRYLAENASISKINQRPLPKITLDKYPMKTLQICKFVNILSFYYGTGPF